MKNIKSIEKEGLIFREDYTIIRIAAQPAQTLERYGYGNGEGRE